MGNTEEKKTNNAPKSIHSGHRKRMREKYLRGGVNAFEPHEMLEMLLYTSISRGDTNPIAHRLIDKFGSFSGVLDASFDDLQTVDGVGESTAFLIKLIPAAARVYLEDRCDKSTALQSAKDYVNILRSKYFDIIDELPSILLIDASYRLIKWAAIGKGGKFSAQIDTKQLIHEVVHCNAAYVVMCHNHPSGNTMPSDTDITVTQNIKSLLDSVDCKLIDHIIISDSEYTSLANSKYQYLFHSSKSSSN